MNNNLLIVGAGIYGVLAKEIAESMRCFDKIDFIDDNAEVTPNGIAVKGKFCDLLDFSDEYQNIIVAIGNPKFRCELTEKIERGTKYNIATLVSPQAYVSPSAEIAVGCIIEPMAVVHTKCVLSRGCIVSAGAVVNHAARCGEFVHVDCNATVSGYCMVPAATKVFSGTVYNTEK